MIGFSKAASAIAILGLSFALMGAASSSAAPSGSVTIFNPGNADLTGYAIAVDPDGEAWTIDATGRGQGQLPSSLTQVFFADLAAAGPLAQLAARPCAAAGNTSPAQLGIFLSWHGQHSPNLQCATDPRADRLLADAQAIAHTLYIQPLRARPVVLNYGRGGAAGSYHAYAPARSTGGYGAAATSNYSGGSYGGSGYSTGMNGGNGYGGGSYGGGNPGYINANSGGSNYGGAYPGGYGNGSLGISPMSGGYGISGNSSFASSMHFDTSFFTNFSANQGAYTQFGHSGTFGSGSPWGSLPTGNAPTGSVGSGLPTSGLPTNSTVTSSTPH